ncbi:MAG: alpha/beta hydrolase-fold protein [Roseiflexaceae bacterium]|nr:alpha/beta hydrolase-fold protein [Roseiflexus sp.]MDW8211913.1 alpha/beta hydrolase-fold protein [Roseiflexaceae bacterium]
MSGSALFRPTFTDLRVEVERRVASDASPDAIAALIDEFLAAGGDTPAPIIEYDGAVTWLFRSSTAQSVSVVGDILGYRLDQTRMTRLQGSDLFYLTTYLPLDAHVAYAFAVDVPEARSHAHWLDRCMPDPLNPQRIIMTNPLRVMSALEMPGAAPLIAGCDTLAETPMFAGMHVVWSAALGCWRRLWVYLPPGYDPATRRYPTIYLLDGEAYLLSAELPLMLDLLIDQKEASPVIAVLIEPPPVRVSSTIGLRFVVDDVVPWIDARYATSHDPLDRIIGGADEYATRALTIALQRPDVFGGALAQSPQTPPTRRIAALLDRRDAYRENAPRCYVDVGRYDDPAAVESTQALCNVLVSGGAVVSYQEFAGGRSFAGWRVTLPDALRFHFGSSSLASLD